MEHNVIPSANDNDNRDPSTDIVVHHSAGSWEVQHNGRALRFARLEAALSTVNTLGKIALGRNGFKSRLRYSRPARVQMKRWMVAHENAVQS